jgi:hypothetical protein
MFKELFRGFRSRIIKRGSSLQPQALEPLPESTFSFEK